MPVPVVIVQHMPPLFTKMMAERLTSKSAIPVHEGAAGVRLEPGHVWIAPGDYHMTVARRGLELHLELNQGMPENSCRPAVDPMFRSVAQTYGRNALAVVMTGMGSDGALGAKAIREAGGEVLVQDEASSVVWGMPGAVVAAGVTDQIYPVGRIADEITKRVRFQRPLRAAAAGPKK
jgi:two-component system chemotaxis response regulator CheB